jgi:hypothetical protein
MQQSNMENNTIVEHPFLRVQNIVALPMVLIPNIINIRGYLHVGVDEC